MPPSFSSVSANRSSVAATRCVGGIGRLFTSATIPGRIGSIIPRSSTVMPGAQLLEAVGLGEDLVVGRHARREVGLEDRAGEAGRVTGDELAAVEPGGDDVDHAVGAAEHAEHVHHLGQPADLVPRRASRSMSGP